MFEDLEESRPNAPKVSGENKLSYDSYFISNNEENRKRRTEKFNRLA